MALILYNPEIGSRSDYFKSCPDGRARDAVVGNNNYPAWKVPVNERIRWARVFDDKVLMAAWETWSVQP